MDEAEIVFFFFFQAEDGIRDRTVTGVQTCALPILPRVGAPRPGRGRLGRAARRARDPLGRGRADGSRRGGPGLFGAAPTVRGAPVAPLRTRAAGGRGRARAQRGLVAGVPARGRVLGRPVPPGGDGAAARALDRRRERPASRPGAAAGRDPRADRRVERARAPALPVLPRRRPARGLTRARDRVTIPRGVYRCKALEVGGWGSTGSV